MSPFTLSKGFGTNSLVTSLLFIVCEATGVLPEDEVYGWPLGGLGVPCPPSALPTLDEFYDLCWKFYTIDLLTELLLLLSDLLFYIALDDVCC